MKCGVCGYETSFLAKTQVLEKYEASYFVCRSCGCVMIENPHWLEEAYRGYVDDVNANCRNAENFRGMSAFAGQNVGPRARMLDYGCGAGMLVKALSDAGFEAFGYDRYRRASFRPGNLTDSYDMVTAFEVFEHFEKPMEEFLSLPRAKLMVISTELVPNGPPSPPGWHYYACWCGQHIFFYTIRALCLMAAAAGYDRLYSTGLNYHVFSKGDVYFSEFEKAVPRLKFERAIITS